MILLALLLAQAVDLAKDGRAPHPVVVGPKASAATKELAAELARYLGRLSGAAFAVESGDGAAGIALALDESLAGGPFERETYRIRSHPKGLRLSGASELALSHAAWDLLHRLGVRQYFPGEAWEVLPPPGDLRVEIDTLQRPAFHARRIWYNWGLWGYNNEPYRRWCARNRMANGFELHSGHAYEAIIAANQAEFDRHPEYYALVDGRRRTKGGDLKLCVSNPELRKLVAAHAARTIRGDSVSMDPSDGGNWCECGPCAKLGSVSDRVLTLANEVADAVAPNYVGMYAYNKHSAPPRVKARPNVIVSATTAFIGGGFTFDQVVDGWKAAGATIGVYDYLSVVDWDWNLPRGAKASRPSAVRDSLRGFHAQGARFYDAESGDCWGPCGLGYYVASRVLWDLETKAEELVDDFLTRAFGPAREPMREFYRLITEDRQRRPWSDLLGRAYRQLDAARRLTEDAAVRRRLEQLVLYCRYVELYTAHAAGAGPQDAFVRHAYRMRATMMIHSYGLWARTVGQKAAHDAKHPLKDERPFSAEEVEKLLADGIAKNAPVDPGFEGVEYGRVLVPAAPLKLPELPPGHFPAAPQDRQQYFVWVPPALDLKIRVQKVWANRAPKISLYSPLEVTLDPVAVDESYKPDGQVYPVTLKTPHPGLHRVEAVDGGDHTRIEWPAGTPVTVESGVDSPHAQSQFRGAWTLYFYVPKGTKTVGGWAARVANWAPRISGKLLDAEGREALDFGKSEEGWFKVPVPEGHDGRAWKFENSQGLRLLMTVPPYFARRPQELLLPREVVEKDAR